MNKKRTVFVALAVVMSVCTTACTGFKLELVFKPIPSAEVVAAEPVADGVAPAEVERVGAETSEWGWMLLKSKNFLYEGSAMTICPKDDEIFFYLEEIPWQDARRVFGNRVCDIVIDTLPPNALTITWRKVPIAAGTYYFIVTSMGGRPGVKLPNGSIRVADLAVPK